MSDKEIYTISPSGLDVFLACPRKYHYKYTAHIEEPESREKTTLQWLAPNDKGTLIHKAMELYVADNIVILSSKLGTAEAQKGSSEEADIVKKLEMVTFSEAEFEKSWERAVEMIEEDMRGKCTEPTEVPLSAKEKELVENERDCRAALEYLINNMKINRQYPVMTEKRFGYFPGEEGEPLVIKRIGEEDFAIRGSIDRVDYDIETGKYVVIDYKTGGIDKKLKLRDGGRDDLLQDRIYAMAFELLFPDKEVMASRYIFTSSDNEEIYEKMTTKSKERFTDRLWREIKAIRAKEDDPCKGKPKIYPECEDTCEYCGYAELCDAYDRVTTATEE